MTLLPLHLPHRTRRLHVPPFPEVVYGPTLVNADATLHRVPDCPDGGRRAVDTLKALAHRPSWCDRCWPGHRCHACGFPSGDDVLCRRCRTDEHDRERRLDNAA